MISGSGRSTTHDYSSRLNPAQADLYRSWIANRKHLEAIVTDMEKLSARAGELLLRQAVLPRSAPGSADQVKLGGQKRIEKCGTPAELSIKPSTLLRPPSSLPDNGFSGAFGSLWGVPARASGISVAGRACRALHAVVEILAGRGTG